MQRSVATSLPARIAGLLLLAGMTSAESCPSDIGDGDQPSEYTVLISKNAQGGASTGPGGGSLRPAADEFGAMVAFDSDAVNLVSDGNAKRDVFVRERTRSAASTLLVSYRTSDGAQAGEDSQNPSISADGFTVAFEGLSRLVPVGPVPQPPDEHHIFVHDWRVPVTRGVLTQSNLPAGGFMRGPSLSGDGRYVAFYSNVVDLAQPQVPALVYTLGAIQVYVADMLLPDPVITLISHAQGAPGTGGNNSSQAPKISRDGSVVAFESDATNLVNPAVAATQQIFVGFRSGADCELISMQDDETPAVQECSAPSISYDGNQVAFVASVGSGIGGTQVVALRNRSGGTTQVISQVGIGDFVVGPSAPALAGNATSAVFLGDENTTLGPAVPGFRQVWSWTPAGGVRIVSIHVTGNQSADHCDWPAISGDGLWAFWSTAAANLVTTDLNGQRDIFAHGPIR